MGAAQQFPFPGSGSPTTPGVGGGNYTKGATWDGQGVPVSPSTVIVRTLPCQASGNIVMATAESDIAGSCVVEVWKTDFAGAPATAANKISASAPIALVGALKSEDTTLTGWNKAVLKGDIIAFKINTSSTLRWLNVGVEIAPA